MGVPPRDGKITSLVYLQNTCATPIACTIDYYTQSGVHIGPFSGNQFDLPANTSVAFRPVEDDPASVVGGQEAEIARAVPNRPLGTANGNDDKKNGSIVIRWSGIPADIQGFCASYGATAGLAMPTAENPSGLAPYAAAHQLPRPCAASDLAGAAEPCALTVPWYVDSAGVAQGLPPRDQKGASMVYLHNNWSEPVTCTVEYYTQDGVYIGPEEPDTMFTIGVNASIAFRPVADDPASVPGGQEADPGRSVPNRPLGTANGNDNKTNGAIVVRWNGRPSFVQGMCATYINTPALGPSVTSYVLPQAFATPLSGASANTINVPWYVDAAGPATAIPPRDGLTATLVYLHNNRSESLVCTMEYYTQDDVYIGPFDAPAAQFTVPANASIAFRPVADDPASVPRGQEAPPARAVPNRPMGTDNGNDNKKNGVIVIRWNGSPYDVQGVSSMVASPSGMEPATSDNPNGMSGIAFSYLLPTTVGTGGYE